MHLDCKSILEQPSNSVDSNSLTSNIGCTVANFEQMWLNIMKTCVEHELQVTAAWHLRDELMFVHNLGHIECLFTQHLTQFFSPSQSLTLVG